MIRILALSSLLALGCFALAAPEGPEDANPTRKRGPDDPKEKKAPPAAERKPEAEPKKEDPAGEVDVAKTTERIVQDANEAGKRLADKDPGDDTQRLQKEIVKNIDALIKKAQQPPPQSNDNSQSQSGKSDMSKSPKDNSSQSKSGSSQSRQERRERRQSQASGKQGGQPMSQQGRVDQQAKLGASNDRLNKMEQSPNKIESKNALPNLSDVYKDVWGHLPEKMRQEMDLYFREQFMPRYSELLKQYYSSLSEKSGKPANGP